MRIRNIICSFAFLFICVLLFAGCSKDSGSDATGPGGSGSTVTDIDGNVYHTVTIGTQTWMVENLEVTKYRNGDAIPIITDAKALGTAAYCNYDNSLANGNIYGRLYNWYAVMDSRKICPLGWHIPSKTEFEALQISVNYNGNALKAIGQGTGNGTGTNTSGFSALLAGQLYDRFRELGSRTFFWSSTENNGTGYPNFAFAVDMWSDFPDIFFENHWQGYGYSVRCIKD